MIELLIDAIEREYDLAREFNEFDKKGHKNDLEDWSQGFMQGVKEGKLVESRRNLEKIKASFENGGAK